MTPHLQSLAWWNCAPKVSQGLLARLPTQEEMAWDEACTPWDAVVLCPPCVVGQPSSSQFLSQQGLSLPHRTGVWGSWVINMALGPVQVGRLSGEVTDFLEGPCGPRRSGFLLPRGHSCKHWLSPGAGRPRSCTPAAILARAARAALPPAVGPMSHSCARSLRSPLRAAVHLGPRPRAAAPG